MHKQNLKFAAGTAAVLAGLSSLTLPNVQASTLKYEVETKLHYRQSEQARFPVNFPPDAFLETVNEGGHIELSNIATQFRWQVSENLRVMGKLDLIDLHERNTTSGDNNYDVDTLFLRYGTKHANGALPETWSAYGQVGKFAKFERQEDRHLESYGLVSTSFNRLEDAGFEGGVDHSSGFYAKLSYTVGTPVFFRDPNALSGDNGVFNDPDQDIKSGFPILYDAEIEDFEFGESAETGLGIGFRWLSENGLMRLNVLAFNYQRVLRDTVKINGSAYGGDLDLLVIEPSELPPGTITSDVGLNVQGDDKSESGVNVWWYAGNSSVFIQHVNQEIAGLKRSGSEIELSYAIENLLGFTNISPVVRWSNLEVDFGGPALFPAPSIWWDWEKIDLGVNFDFKKEWRLTIEYAMTTFVRANKDESNNELLATLRWQWGN